MADSSIRQDLNPLQPSVYYRSEAENRLELEKTLGELLRVAGYGVVSDYVQHLAGHVDNLASDLKYNRSFKRYCQLDKDFGKTHLTVDLGLALAIDEEQNQLDGSDWAAVKDLCGKVLDCVSPLKVMPRGIISPGKISIIKQLADDLRQMNLAMGLTCKSDEAGPVATEQQKSVASLPAPNTAAVASPGKTGGKGLRRNWQGMTWQVAQDKAERHVKRNGWPGVNVLVNLVGCGKGTLKKAIKNSSYLTARKAEYQANRSRKPREVPLSEYVLGNTPEQANADQLATLIDEQKAEIQREGRQHQAAKRRRSRPET